MTFLAAEINFGANDLMEMPHILRIAWVDATVERNRQIAARQEEYYEDAKKGRR
jgi:hypothetical protein